jgi:hypothetical protein
MSATKRKATLVTFASLHRIPVGTYREIAWLGSLQVVTSNWGRIPVNFLHWPIEQSVGSSRFKLRRREMALRLFKRFAKAFPQIIYELAWECPTINAQAWSLGRKRYVRVYGGLVRYHTITRSGLSVALAHETGHHLGGSPPEPDMPWITWQGQADYWAGRTGMPLVFGRQATPMTLRGARELLTLHSDLAAQYDDDGPNLAPEFRYDTLCAGALGLDFPVHVLRAYPGASNHFTLKG